MKAKNLSMGLRILFGFLSVILCVALFSTIVASMVLADARTLTDKDNMKMIINHVVFGTPIKGLAPSAAPQAIGGMKLEEFTTGETTTEEGLTGIQEEIVSKLYEMLTAQIPEDQIPFTEEEVGELLAQSTLPDFLSDKMADIVTDVYTGEITTTITGAEIVQELEKNEALIKEVLDIELSEEYKTQIAETVDQKDLVGMVENFINTGSFSGVDEETGDQLPMKPKKDFSNGVLKGVITGEVTVQDILDGGIPAMLAALREVTSVEMLLTMLAACAVIIALLFLLNMKQLRVAVRCVGITAMLAALPFVGVTVLAYAVPSMFEGTILSLVYLAITATASISFGVFALGLVLFILSIVMTVIHKRNMRVPVLVAEPVTAGVAPEMPTWNPAPQAPAEVVEEPVEEAVAAEEILPVEEIPEEPSVAEAPAAEEIAEEAPAPEETPVEEPAEETTNQE